MGKLQQSGHGQKAFEPLPYGSHGVTILSALRKHNTWMPVGKLVKTTNLSHDDINRHLEVLERAKLVKQQVVKDEVHWKHNIGK